MQLGCRLGAHHPIPQDEQGRMQKNVDNCRLDPALLRFWNGFGTLTAQELLAAGQGELPNLMAQKEPGPASCRVPKSCRDGFSEPGALIISRLTFYPQMNLFANLFSGSKF